MAFSNNATQNCKQSALRGEAGRVGFSGGGHFVPSGPRLQENSSKLQEKKASVSRTNNNVLRCFRKHAERRENSGSTVRQRLPNLSDLSHICVRRRHSEERAGSLLHGARLLQPLRSSGISRRISGVMRRSAYKAAGGALTTRNFKEVFLVKYLHRDYFLAACDLF